VPQEEIKLIHSQLRTAQDKYTYFLLAIAASAIAFSIQLTKTDPFSFSLVPLGIAVLAWCGSFFAGCKNIEYVNSTLFANAEYLKAKSGLHPDVGNNPSYIAAATEGIMDALNNNAKKAGEYGQSQFRLLVLGACFFITWHLIQMACRTILNN